MNTLTTKLVFWLLILTASASIAADKQVLVQSTTSTANSGLYKYLLPQFEAQTNIKVNVVAVGTGQAIRNARNCDADVLLVHAKQAEEAFVEDGFGIKRHDLMYNDFVMIGPENDPARISNTTNIQSALQAMAKAQTLFASRGDNSGTHKKELQLWHLAKLDMSATDANWYRSTGSGMGATINTAIGLGAYTLTDRATWISFKNKQDFKILFEGDSALFNQYGVILVNSEKCPNVSKQNAERFISWLLSNDTQTAIAEFEIDGQQLFYPNAN